MERALALLDDIATLAPGEALREAEAVLRGLTPFLSARVGDVLATAPRAAASPDFVTVARSQAFALELFRWPPGARTPIHDHTSWGIYVCLTGQLGEERYASVDGVARLRREWTRLWLPNDASTLMPYEGGIHRVRNAGLTTAVSLHLYGPRVSDLDGRDYEPARSFVCDRLAA
jgi:predicted metal-dependent enzyme (double-stranded beta helix superfamily)